MASTQQLLHLAVSEACIARAWHEAVEPNPRLGLCYALSGKYVSSHPKATLVHGQLINPFGKGYKVLDHGWVEEGDEVFDPVMDKRWPKAAYYGLFQAKVFNTYTFSDVNRITSECGHWGPWDDSDKPLSESKHETEEISHEEACALFPGALSALCDELKWRAGQMTTFTTGSAYVASYVRLRVGASGTLYADLQNGYGSVDYAWDVKAERWDKIYHGLWEHLLCERFDGSEQTLSADDVVALFPGAIDEVHNVLSQVDPAWPFSGSITINTPGMRAYFSTTLRFILNNSGQLVVDFIDDLGPYLWYWNTDMQEWYEAKRNSP